MSQSNPGGEESDFKQKLNNLDQWLKNIVQPSSLPKNNPATPTPVPDPKAPTSSQQPNALQPKNKRPFNKVNKNSMNTNTSVAPNAKPSFFNRREKNAKPAFFKKGKLRIIPLGGLEEVGKNMMVFEYDKDIIIVDMGFQFPEEDMLGIDYVLPDVSYLMERKQNIRGVFLTHGHLDHIGGIPYLLPRLGFPMVYGAPLTMGFVKKQLEEFRLNALARTRVFDPKEKFRLGAFEVSFFRVNHSIPDAVAVVIDCPAGRIVHTGDFKFDFSPADQRPADFQEIATVGKKGVMVLVSDSTNSLEPGQTTSEKVIAENLDDIIRKATGRLIITSFSSLIGRLQQIMDSSMKYRRKIFLSGRSMATNIKIAQQLGYIKVPRGVIIDIRDLKRFPDDEIIILTTGSQGEDISALARMAMDTHLQVKIGKGDTVVLSSSPIIGNEGAINKVINNLCQRGAKVITNNEIDVHTSGHAKQEDLKLMIKLISPKYMIPAHGDLYMRMAHRDLAVLCDVPEKNVFLLDNGAVVEGDTNGEYQKTKEKVPAEYIMVEGPEKSQVEGSVLMDRHLMSENGVLIVTLVISKATGLLSQKPEVVSRGFVFMDTSKQVSEKVVQEVEKSFQQFIQKPTGNSGDKRKDLEHHIHHSLDRFLVRLLDKRPMVMPVVIVQ